MQIDEHSQAAVLVLSPRGPLAGSDGTVLESRVDAASKRQHGRVVIDCTHVSYLDSDGLEALVNLGEAFRDVARPLKLAAVNETVREVLDLTEVGALCELYDDASAAVRSFE